MKATSSLLFVSFVALCCVLPALSQITPSIPVLPTQFSAAVVVSTTVTRLQLKGTLYYDYVNNRQRFDSSLFGIPQTELDIFNNSTRYVFETNGGKCQKCALTSTLFPLYVLDLSTYLGRTDLNGKEVDLWTMSHPVFDLTMTWWVDTYTSYTPTLVQANFTVGDVSTWMTFSNQDPSVPDPSYFVPPTQCAPMSCNAPANLVFLVDGSSSIGYSDFTSVKSFLSSVVQSFELSTTGANVGVIQFSDYPQTAISLSSSESQVLAAIENMREIAGGTNLATAIEAATVMLTTASRSYVPNLMIILTDGSTSPDPTYAANAAKGEGIEIFCVAVGTAEIYVLQSVASQPTSTHFFDVNEFDELTNLLDAVVANTCSNYNCDSSAPMELSSGFRALWNQALMNEEDAIKISSE